MLKSFLEGVIDFVYPRYCLVCKENKENLKDVSVCSSCWSQIAKIIPPFCQRCGQHIEKNQLIAKICTNCQRIDFHFDRAWSSCLYQGIIRELIHLFKYKGMFKLGKKLSCLLIEFINNYHLPVKDFDFLVPIPLHRRKLREREFNQAEILASNIAEEFNLKVSNNNLFRLRDTRSQTELTDETRLNNVKGAFRIKKPEEFRRKFIFLVDDVLTTGATASEAARTLKEAGASVVFVLTLARTV